MINPEQEELSADELCKNGRIYSLLNEYLNACKTGEMQKSEGTDSIASPKSKKISFPNLAGFCRHIGIGVEEFLSISDEYPQHSGRILTVLEDEALNSGISASLLSAYLKKRLGYEAQTKASSTEQQLCISFEHDIFEDGE